MNGLANTARNRVLFYAAHSLLEREIARRETYPATADTARRISRAAYSHACDALEDLHPGAADYVPDACLDASAILETLAAIETGELVP